jgi:large subunit ribosomal protein L25
VVYGHGVPSTPLRVEARALATLLSRGGAHRLVRLAVQGEGAPRTVVIKEVQRHPVSREVRHVDFQAVSASERIHAEVPLRPVGEDEIARAGGVLQVLLHALRVACLPGDLPDHIDVPVAGISVGGGLAVRDLPLPSGVVALHDPDDPVVHVLAPRTGGGEAAEPAAAAPADAAAKAKAE